MGTLTAYDLRTEYRHEPLGIDANLPRASWRLRSDHRGAKALAARVVCRTGEDVVWDSGWTEDPAVDGIMIESNLAPMTRYDWSLWLRDADGNEDVVGQTWFETGYLDSSLPGAWIGRDRHFDRPDRAFDPPVDDDIPVSARRIPPALYLRKAFAVEGTVRRARLSASAHGIYRAHLNGSRVGGDELTPGWTDYTDRVLYQTYDVTEQVSAGNNALGMIVADGWWSGYIGFDRRRQGNFYGTEPAGWAALEIEFTDGTTRTIATDDSWHEAPGEILYTDLLMGEYVDRRRHRNGWDTAEFTADGWGPARVTSKDLSKLQAQVDDPIRVIEEVQAQSVSRDPEGRFIYDFGQNLVGRVRLPIDTLHEGGQIVLRHGEMLEHDRLYTANLRTAEARDVYVSDGADHVFEPTFTLHGFRYLEVSGDLSEPPAPERVLARVMHNAFDWSGELETSNEAVNQLISNIRWGQRGNFVGVPTDCPQRDERLGWLADAQVFLPTAALNADIQSFFTRWLRDVRYAQSAEGSFEDVAPVISLEFADGAPAWGDGGVLMPWHLYRAYGDTRLLTDSFDSMTRWVDFIERENPSLLWTRRVGSNYGDWLQVDASTDRAVLATAYFAQSAAIVSAAATALGKDDLAQRYGDLAGRIRQAFTSAYVGADGRIEGDTQTTYLLALAFNLVPDDVRPLAAKHLVQAIEDHDGLLTTGFVGVALLCPVLSDIGRDDLAFSLLETDQYPSWLYSVSHGATTIWERWDGWTEEAGFQSVEMNSFNHYSLGSVGEWIYRYVAGIDQATNSVGYRRLHLAPRVGGTLTHASASYESPLGLVRSGWRLAGEHATFEFLIPPGSTADITLPGVHGELEGLRLADSPHVQDLQVGGTHTQFVLPSGSYSISTRLNV